MGESFQTMLDYRELSATYRAAPTMQGTPFTDLFFQNPEPTTADGVMVYRVGSVNKPAPGNTRGSNPRQLASPSLDEIMFNLFYSFNELQIDARTLKFLRSTDANIQRVGRELLDQQLGEAGRQQRMFREVVLQQVFAYGRVNLGADGQILVPTVDAASGAITNNASAQQVVDYGIKNNRRGDCGDVFGAAGGGFWDAADTQMFQQLENSRDEQLKAGSMPLTTVWMNRKRAPALINNTQFKIYAAQNNLRNEAILAGIQGGALNNIWGFNFKFVEGYWTDSAGVQRPIIPMRQVLLTPDGTDWFRRKEGTEDVPTQVGIFNDFDAALASLKPVVGMFSFAQAIVTPKVKLSVYMGDNFGVGFPDPNAFWMPTVFSE